MGTIKNKAIKNSQWIYHFNASSCQHCNLELLTCFSPKYDIESKGLKLINSIRQADILLITGTANEQIAAKLKETYNQASKTIIVIACGTCACSGGIFSEIPDFAGPIDKIIPVDIYLPGCPPNPETIIDSFLNKEHIHTRYLTKT
jgi:membrane-bound hydrogenase subunit mbhJ